MTPNGNDRRAAEKLWSAAPGGFESAPPPGDAFREQYAQFLEQHAPPLDSAAGADWPTWRPTPNDQPSSLIRIGRARLREYGPDPVVCFGGMGEYHTSLAAGKESEELARQLALRIAGDAKHVRILVCDFARTGAFRDFVGTNISRNVFPAEADEVFEELDRHMHKMATVRGARPGTPRDPWRLLLMTGQPPTRYSEAVFKNLIDSTNWGALIAVGTEIPYREHIQSGVSDRLNYYPDPPVPRELISRTMETLAETSRVKPLTSDELVAAGERLPSSKGIEIRFGTAEDGSIHKIILDDSGAHLVMVGRTGSGKTIAFSQIARDVLAGYPEDVEVWLFDGKGADFTAFVSEGKNDPDFPNLRVLGNNVEDPEDWLANIQSLVDVMEDRYRQMRLAGVKSLDELRRKTGQTFPRILFMCDEVDKMLNNPLGMQILTSVNLLATKARQAGIHLALAAQSWKNIDLMHVKAGTFEQFTHRIVMKGKDDETVTASWIDERAMARALPNQAVINNKDIVTVPLVTFDDVRRLRRLAGGRAGTTAIVDGMISPVLAESRPYQELRPARGRAAAGLVGQMPGFDGRAGRFEFSDIPGRNIGIVGAASPEETTQVMRSVATSVGVQHVPGEVKFTILNHNQTYLSAAKSLEAQLAELGHTVAMRTGQAAHATLEEIAEQLEGSNVDGKHYVIVYGADAVQADKFGKVLSKGSERGTHVIATAASLGRLMSAAGPYVSLSELASMMNGIVSVGIDHRELAALTGEPITGSHPTWQGGPRPGRALFFDALGNTGRMGLTVKTYK